MPDQENHWLLEPHVQHFFADFPTPLAVLRSDGSIVALNSRFTDSYDAACLKSEAVRQLVKSPSAVWTAISLIGSDGTSIPGQVKALLAEDNAVFPLFSEPLDNVENAELGQLRLQLSQLERLVVTDRRLEPRLSRPHDRTRIQPQCAQSATAVTGHARY